MKILIGLVYYAENEYHSCRKSIHSQSYSNWELFIVEQLPKKEAHEKLYSTFMRRSSEFDLFLKIDADMVLCRNTFFQELVDAFTTYPDVDIFHIRLQDHFTNTLIYGMNVYRSHVTWTSTDENYFTDRGHVPSRVKTFSNPEDGLVPAAEHAPNPSPFQAYHYGVHRMVKVIQSGSSLPNLRGAYGHLTAIHHTIHHYKTSGKGVLKYSVIGAWQAFENRWDHRYADYDSTELRDGFRQVDVSDMKRIYFRWATWIPLSVWCHWNLARIHGYARVLLWRMNGAS